MVVDLAAAAARAAWLGLLLTICVFCALMLMPKDALEKKIADVGVVDLDGGPFWDEAFIRRLCEGYGADGRVRAATGYLKYCGGDCTFALCYSSTMAFSLFSMTYGKASGLPSLLPCFVPLLAGLCDLFENFSVMRLLLSYPDFDPVALMMGPTFSKLKTALGLASVVLLIYHKAASLMGTAGGDAPGGGKKIS
mmetsp:Transcript_12862/g.29175  ORF Transcript_12862/g.29175 Transcript_12862/m.29175 type:complete len:194 (-) Transcript_12862:48-629(-)